MERLAAADKAGDPYRGITAAVFGASGFIGGWVARALAASGARVVLVARDAGRIAEMTPGGGGDAQYNIAEADLSRYNTARDVIATWRPAIVFNLAGYGVDRGERDEQTAYVINAELPGRIVQALADYRNPDWRGQQLVHVGSALEYGEIAGDLAESSSPNPTTLYGRSKLAGTRAVAQACAKLNVRGITARLFTVYGAGEHAGRLLPALIEAARQEGRVPLSAGLQHRDFTYVEDVVEGLLRLGLVESSPPGDIVNLATGQLTAVRSFAEEAARLLGIKPERLVFGALPTRTEEMQHDPVSVERLRALVGWVPGTSVSEGIARTVSITQPSTSVPRSSPASD